MLGAILIMVWGCLILPCLLPLVMRSVSILLEAILEQNMATQLSITRLPKSK
jgi:uncharacterized membrane protein